MSESIDKRIELIMGCEETEELKSCLCPFFQKGGYPECKTCRKAEADLEECRDYYLERIKIVPMDFWSEDFDKFMVMPRETVPIEEVSGIGVNCDNCYMYDKCPLYKKGYACGIKWDSKRPQTPMDFMDFLVNTQYERVKRSSVFEKIDGGVPDVGLSTEIDRLHDLVASKIDMGRERLSINVEATGAAAPTSGGGGILAKLFGGGGTTALPEETKMISATPESREGILDIQEVEEIKEPVKVTRQRKKKNE